MTKDTEEISQFTKPVTCREYPLPKDEKSSWIRGNTKIGPDNSHSWVRISHGLNTLVDLIDKECDDNKQETSEMKFEEFALKTNVVAFAS